MRKIMILVLVCLTMLTISNQAGELDKETIILLGKASYTPYQDEYEKMLYPTVRITTPNGIGSGVIFETTDSHGLTQMLILTACHVVDKENTVNIELYNSTVITGTVVITDTVKDLALIRTQINADLTDLQDKLFYAKLASRDYQYFLFTPVCAIGCSLGLEPRPSYGHITHIEKSNPCSSVSICGYEISAPVLPGNSGGPVYDARTYEVIGIAVWVKVYQYQLVTTMAGVVPINQIYEFLTSHPASPPFLADPERQRGEQDTKTPRK